MVFVRLILITVLLSSCQLGYYLHLGYNQLSIHTSTESYESVLNSDRFTPLQKNKIELVKEVRVFAFEKLNLHKSKNYSEFVDLKRPYVTYTVSASEKWKFEPYLWGFPIIGKAPYKGFFKEELAKEEAEKMKKKGLDVSVRGVSAYSTLGKLTDPLLSSMLNYSEHDLVNTIIHELTHTTLFIKDNIDFNERLAVFVGGKGTALFYLYKEGPDSKTLKLIQDENADDALFSVFITKEIELLKKWYEDFDHTKNIPSDEKEALRQERLALIKTHFEKKLKPKLKTNSYERFFNKKFNNADLSVYHTYMTSLDVFEKVYIKSGSNIRDFLKKCEALNDVDDPQKELEKWANEW